MPKLNEVLKTKEGRPVELPRFVSVSGLGEYKSAVILTPRNGSYAIEAIGGQEVIAAAEAEGLPSGDGFGAISQLLREGVEHNLLNIGDMVPMILTPELGMAFAEATDRTELLGHFVVLQQGRAMHYGYPQIHNPLFWDA